ncbi:leucine-rich repeat-containing protein 14 [Lampris incognitus]|uniref:leucine-rich repeat-containing protein 14 n=1 Tax=Lampris incognitus TaxID=2546036 RepID=UPI0024B6113E|nr:leucine-rich repeat-containing protein 14 [Lampris incognitus]
MVLSLVNLCAKVVVSDHSSSPHWLSCVPRELYGSLLDAAFTGCRPLAVGELVQRWPERTLRVGGRKKPRKSPPNRLCIQALLLAVVRGLTDPRCVLQVLDLCGLQGEEGGMGDPMGGWSLTVALCSMVLQAKIGTQREKRREGERERKRFRAMEREKDLVKKERGQENKKSEEEARSGNSNGTDTREPVRNGEQGIGTSVISGEEQKIKGVRRRMEMERRESKVSGSRRESEEIDIDSEVVMHVRADLFVNARSWERVRLAMRTVGPLKLQCRYLRVEELTVSRIKTLLELLPRQGLLGLDVRYSSLGVAGLTELLPQLSTFPALSSFRLYYCNLDLHRDQPGQEGTLRDLSLGLAQLKQLSHLSFTALRLPGHLRMLLSSLSQPLEVLEMPYLSLSPSDLAYLSCSQHASTLQQLDLSENRLDETTLPSVRRLLSQASGNLQHLCLSGCGLTDRLLGALLPSLSCCRALKSLGLSLNPLSMAGLLDLVRTAVRMPSLRQLLYPNPLEDYQPGLPELPSSAQLLDWPLDELMEVHATHSQLNRVVTESGRSDLFLTCDLINYDKDLVE